MIKSIVYYDENQEKLLGRNSYEQVNTTISRKLLYEY